jgi:hypothetical protein
MPAPGPLGWLFGEDAAARFRYRQLLASVPHGDFYTADGQVLPFKGNTPHDVQVSTTLPNTIFNVFVNDIYIKSVTSGLDGVVSLSIKLVKGRNDIKLATLDEPGAYK